MRKKSSVFIYALIMGLLVLSNSCKKEDIPVLTTSAVTEITQTTAISGGNISSDGGATITARGVCWGTEQTPTISDNKTTDGTGTGNFTSNISDLSANTTYYVRAYASNSKGTAYGTAISFITKSSNAQTEVTFYTSMGTFIAELYDTLQPITSGNFIRLVNEKFYDGIIFHRVINNFMIQGGDPTGTGSGGPGYAIPDEFDPLTSNVQKALAMANSGPNTGGSQFFINLVDNLYLNPNYPVFGIVTSNFSVVQAIGSVQTNSSNKPLTNVVMDSVRVTNK